MSEIDKKELEKAVRRILMELLSGRETEDSSKTVDPSGVMSVRTAEIRPEPFDTGKSGDKVFLKDVSTLSESPRLGFGVMEMDRSTFKWTLNYDEVDYVIEGRLDILIDGRKISGQAGDVIFIPAGSTIEFSTPDRTRFFYVVYPANWYDQ
jgi:ethanolamine utilization protein EutQ